MQVPSSKDSRLFKMLTRAEPRLTKLTKYQVKYVERGGRPLAKQFSPPMSNSKCFRQNCSVCKNHEGKKPSLCQVKSVVYVCVCTLCDKEHKCNPTVPHKGRYIGETARTLSERSDEHFKGLRRFDPKNFLVKHWDDWPFISIER